MLKNKKTLLLSSLLILLPIVAGLLLWNKLPEQIPTHWNAAGEVDDYSSRGFAVLGLPLLLFMLHWVCILVTVSDKNNHNQSTKVQNMVLWICPVISLIGSAAIYSTVLGYSMNMTTLPCLLVGVMFLFLGNYLPKCKHNFTIGIKLPWTLASEENWNATHRFSGRVWVFGGLVIGLIAFLPGQWCFIAMMAVLLTLVLLPTLYSYRYMKIHR